MLRVTPDTNVIVSGLYGAGNPRWILAAAEAGRIRLKLSAAILEEIWDVLQRRRFGWTADEASAAIDWLAEIADVVEPKQTRCEAVTGDYVPTGYRAYRQSQAEPLRNEND